MKGKIINYDHEKSFGFIMGENGQTYFFHASNTNAPFEISVNKMVDFHPSTNEKGFRAKNVVLGNKATYNNNHNTCKPKKQYSQPKPKKKKFVTIGDIVVDLNDVKSAQVHGDGYNAKLLIKTYSSGTLVGYYSHYSAIHDAQDDLSILLNQL